MPERTRRHFALSFALTLACVIVSEITHHFLRFNDTVSAGVFLLGLVPIAYGALRAGFFAGLSSTFLLSFYVLHYAAPHADGLAWRAWPSFLVVFALGAAMSAPMSYIHQRELRFRREIKAHTASLERKNAELTELNSALEAFGYVVSHDLKEPVRAIENYLAAAQEDWPKEDSRTFVREAHEANRRLSHMLQGLLDYSRTSTLPSTPRELSLEEIFESDLCKGRYETLFEERGARLEIGPALPRVRGDEVLLCQAFGNLLLNAVSHNTTDKPIVRVERAEAPAGRARIAITDNGPGFPREVIARYDRLPRRGPATVKTGFGLIIAQRALRRLDGELWIENAPEGGAVAHVELPGA